MARVTDVADAAYRTELAEAEKLLDEGEYSEVVRRSADIFLRLATAHPDLVIEARPRELRLDRISPEYPLFQPWPSQLGVAFTFDAEGNPQMTFEKDEFTMAVAVTYFEYALDSAVRAQERAR